MEAALNSPQGRIVLGAAPLKIGRAPDNTMVITDPQSSSHHAEVAPGYGGNGYQITDLNSTNGSYVNEQRLTPNQAQPLNNGDVIRIGSTRITYEAANAGYQPTIAASAPNYEPTIMAGPGSFPQSGANFSSPQQQPYTPPPVYPQPQPQQAYPQAQPPAYPPQQAYPQPPAYPQPQPAYPQQAGGYGQPGYAQPQKKSRAGCWIAAIVVIILLVAVAGGGYYVYNNVLNSPSKTLAAYCDGLKTSNATELYNQLDAADQQQTSVSKIQQSLTLLSALGGIKDCTYTNVQQNGSTATATVTITYGGPIGSKSEPINLIKENGAWKLQSSTPNS